MPEKGKGLWGEGWVLLGDLKSSEIGGGSEPDLILVAGEEGEDL